MCWLSGHLVLLPCAWAFLSTTTKNGLSLEVGNSLVRASVSVVNCETSQRGQTILVGSLFNVTSLELDGFSAMVKPVVGPNEFPMLGNLRTLFLDECDLRDNFRILRHFLQRCPNLEKLTIRLCELPEISTGGKGGKLKTTGKGGAKSKKTHSGFRNLVRIQYCKLKSTEIIYKKGVKIQELVSLLLDISECAPMNTTTLTKYEEAMDMDLSD